MRRRHLSIFCAVLIGSVTLTAAQARGAECGELVKLTLPDVTLTSATTNRCKRFRGTRFLLRDRDGSYGETSTARFLRTTAWASHAAAGRTE